MTFSGAAGLGGDITAGVLNQEYKSQDSRRQHYTHFCPNGGHYHCRHYRRWATCLRRLVPATAQTLVTVVLLLLEHINQCRLEHIYLGAGWGIGFWGRGAWGSAAATPIVTSTLRFWTHDNFGEDLLVNVRNGGIYYWDKTGGFVHGP